jgi:hypothetical protein
MTSTLTAVAVIAGLVILFALLGTVAKIQDHASSIADDVHIVRAGSIKIRSDLTAALAAVERLEKLNRGPAGAYEPPPARTSAHSTEELEPAP